MRRYLRRHVEDALAEQLIANYSQTIVRANLSCDEENNLKVECFEA
jgi:hypothetical protein